ncbi:hypothetical protein GXY_11449 [Novacetimonas hansenii ATCC 23769]|uniref:Uncharacterized protein n=1 Tax=Novacetimonas hansenii ATCC 23769 TaxID=714995 RepID=D5QGL8_NOVHA|nr:hypothetical protein GXY_11449 [Novacetimonas hansenii ATCC 23769]
MFYDFICDDFAGNVADIMKTMIQSRSVVMVS